MAGWGQSAAAGPGGKKTPLTPPKLLPPPDSTAAGCVASVGLCTIVAVALKAALSQTAF